MYQTMGPIISISHSQQMGEGLYVIEVQRMVCSTVKKWIRKLKGIRKYHDQVSFINNETFTCRVVNRLLQLGNFVTRKRKYFSRLESITNICCCRILLGFFVDPFKEIKLFDQTIEINMTSVVWLMSEEYNNKETVFHDYDSDDEFCDLENLDFNR